LSLFVLVELAHGNDLPDEFETALTIRHMQALAVDITPLHNVLLSYHKEESESIPHNILQPSFTWAWQFNERRTSLVLR
jgi:hypothetical protein